MYEFWLHAVNLIQPPDTHFHWGFVTSADTSQTDTETEVDKLGKKQTKWVVNAFKTGVWIKV